VRGSFVWQFNEALYWPFLAHFDDSESEKRSSLLQHPIMGLSFLFATPKKTYNSETESIYEHERNITSASSSICNKIIILSIFKFLFEIRNWPFLILCINLDIWDQFPCVSVFLACHPFFPEKNDMNFAVWHFITIRQSITLLAFNKHVKLNSFSLGWPTTDSFDFVFHLFFLGHHVLCFEKVRKSKS
jgi:hypothetical protein